ncbi:MAG: SEC-C domain-containing protein, partial [Desulfobulbaceae bacterium]|nr:SEC-C domain-containing protein [Desulfobulbaceae bacterium]
LTTVKDAYAEKEKTVGEKTMRQLERYVLLQMVDTYWKEHLLNMDHLKEGIGLQGYGQKNPLNEYKKEGFNMFMAVMEAVKQKTVDTLFRVQLVQDEEVEQMSMEQRRKKQQTRTNRRDGEIGRQPVTREGQKIGRNAPCPCGSGKKYKRCCGNKK